MKDSRRNAALARIERDRYLVEIKKLEEVQLIHLVDLALLQPMSTHRWHAYEALKKRASRFVGWYAVQDLLKSSVHYEAMIDFIVYLLPEEMRGSDMPIGLEGQVRQERSYDIREILQDMVKRMDRSA